MTAAALDPGWVVSIVVLGAVILGALALAGVGRSLTRWRTEVDVPAPDPDHERSTLREEVRQLVIAANARRERRGEPPLDVDAEVERRLREGGAPAP